MGEWALCVLSGFLEAAGLPKAALADTLSWLYCHVIAQHGSSAEKPGESSPGADVGTSAAGKHAGVTAEDSGAAASWVALATDLRSSVSTALLALDEPLGPSPRSAQALMGLAHWSLRAVQSYHASCADGLYESAGSTNTNATDGEPSTSAGEEANLPSFLVLPLFVVATFALEIAGTSSSTSTALSAGASGSTSTSPGTSAAQSTCPFCNAPMSQATESTGEASPPVLPSVSFGPAYWSHETVALHPPAQHTIQYALECVRYPLCSPSSKCSGEPHSHAVMNSGTTLLPIAGMATVEIPGPAGLPVWIET